MNKTQSKEQKKKRKSPPAMTLEGRENQLIALAVNLAEQQLLDGTASSQVITHYLKLGSTRNKKELERLENENKLLRAKTEHLQAEQSVEQLIKDAIKAFGIYKGDEEQDEYDEY